VSFVVTSGFSDGLDRNGLNSGPLHTERPLAAPDFKSALRLATRRTYRHLLLAAPYLGKSDLNDLQDELKDSLAAARPNEHSTWELTWAKLAANETLFMLPYEFAVRLDPCPLPAFVLSAVSKDGESDEALILLPPVIAASARQAQAAGQFPLSAFIRRDLAEHPEEAGRQVDALQQAWAEASEPEPAPADGTRVQLSSSAEEGEAAQTDLWSWRLEARLTRLGHD